MRVSVLPETWEDDEDEEDWYSGPTLSPEEWQKQANEVAEYIATVWPAGISAVDAASEQRR